MSKENNSRYYYMSNENMSGYINFNSETDESEKPDTPKRVQAFSAPPVFLDFDFKVIINR